MDMQIDTVDPGTVALHKQYLVVYLSKAMSIFSKMPALLYFDPGLSSKCTLWAMACEKRREYIHVGLAVASMPQIYSQATADKVFNGICC